MAFRTSQTRCVVWLVMLRGLSATQLAQCEELRREAARCWTDLVTAHREGRERDEWIDVRELERMTAGKYALHSQTIQALAQRLDANLQTAKELRERQTALGHEPTYHYPYKTPPYQTVPWKDMAMRQQDGRLILSNGRGRAPLVLTLPPAYLHADIRRVELTWRADHYELCLTIDTGESAAPLQAWDRVAGVDLGEVHIAAVATSDGRALVVSGRLLRAHKQLRNKRHAALQERLAKRVKGSRRWRRLTLRKAQTSAKLYRQQRDILHKASRKVVAFCQRAYVGRIAVGDVRDAQDGVNMGANNQKITQWPHGQFYCYLADKAQHMGIAIGYIDEGYSTKTCSACGEERRSGLNGRSFACPTCGERLHRDVNGAANICSRARHGAYGYVRVGRAIHVYPVERRRQRP